MDTTDARDGERGMRRLTRWFARGAFTLGGCVVGVLAVQSASHADEPAERPSVVSAVSGLVHNVAGDVGDVLDAVVPTPANDAKQTTPAPSTAAAESSSAPSPADVAPSSEAPAADAAASIASSPDPAESATTSTAPLSNAVAGVEQLVPDSSVTSAVDPATSALTAVLEAAAPLQQLPVIAPVLDSSVVTLQTALDVVQPVVDGAVAPIVNNVVDPVVSPVVTGVVQPVVKAVSTIVVDPVVDGVTSVVKPVVTVVVDVLDGASSAVDDIVDEVVGPDQDAVTDRPPAPVLQLPDAPSAVASDESAELESANPALIDAAATDLPTPTPQHVNGTADADSDLRAGVIADRSSAAAASSAATVAAPAQVPGDHVMPLTVQQSMPTPAQASGAGAGGGAIDLPPGMGSTHSAISWATASDHSRGLLEAILEVSLSPD